MSKWQPLENAPKDGSPVWARGFEFGNKDSGVIAGWIYWNEDAGAWVWAGFDKRYTHRLTEFYLP